MKLRRLALSVAVIALVFLINLAYWPRRRIRVRRPRQRRLSTTDAAIDLFAELDGAAIESIKQHRVSSEECFDIFPRVPSGRRPHSGYPAATDGYWLLVQPRPLSKGHHILKFGGKYNRSSSADGRMLQDIEYELVVQ
jgi:hypothetical protein